MLRRRDPDHLDAAFAVVVVVAVAKYLKSVLGQVGIDYNRDEPVSQQIDIPRLLHFQSRVWQKLLDHLNP
jgi:hypothetical protein